MEQNWMTAEDRGKWLKMTEKDMKDRAEAEKKNQPKMPRTRSTRRR